MPQGNQLAPDLAGPVVAGRAGDIGAVVVDGHGDHSQVLGDDRALIGTSRRSRQSLGEEDPGAGN